MKKTRTILVSALCALVLLTTAVGGMLAQGAPAGYDVGEEPVRSAANPTALAVADILERDGYLEGIWFPWLTHDDLGHGFTANETMVKYVNSAWSTVGIDKYSDSYLLEQIYNLKALGFNIMGYEGSIYAEGVIFDDNGDVVGIKQDYLDNTRRFLNLCRAAGMPVLWTVCCHSTSAVSYYNLEAWYRMTQMYAVKEVADHYAERFVKPLCAVLAEYPDVVVMAAATSEVENEMNDPDMGNFTDSRETYGVTRESMLYFVNTVADTLAECLPNVDRTICGSTDNMTMYSETDLTFVGHQEYNSAGNADDIASFRSPLPMIISEFGLGDGLFPDEWSLTMLQTTFRDNFRAKGWRGWMMWCWSPKSDGSAYDLIEKNGGLTDFRPVAYALHDYIKQYRADYRGEDVDFHTTSIFYNKGNGVLEWVRPFFQHTYVVERSIDGGAWQRVASAALSDADFGDRKSTFKDTTLPQSGTVQYRVTITNPGGSGTATSNVANILPPPSNLMTNGGFENGMDRWTLFGTNGAYRTTTAAARTGSHSLELDYGSAEWEGVYQPVIDVKPNTNYVLTYWYKYASDDTAKNTYCFVRGGEGTLYDDVISSAYMNDKNNTGWKQETISFNTGASSKLCIDFRVVAGAHTYIDDVELYEAQ